MDKLKTIFIIIAVILGIVLGLAVIGMVMTAVKYLFWLGVLCLAAFVAVKLLKKSEPPQLEGKDHAQSLSQAERSLDEYQRSLDEYKRKYLAK